MCVASSSTMAGRRGREAVSGTRTNLRKPHTGLMSHGSVLMPVSSAICRAHHPVQCEERRDAKVPESGECRVWRRVVHLNQWIATNVP